MDKSSKDASIALTSVRPAWMKVQRMPAFSAQMGRVNNPQPTNIKAIALKNVLQITMVKMI